MQIAFLSSRRLALIAAAGAVVALAPMVAAQADEADGSEHVLQFQSQRSRADLARDAAQATQTATASPMVSQETAPPMERAQPGLTRDSVSALAAQAEREGRIPYGEVGAAGE